MHFYKTLFLLISISITSVYGQNNYAANVRYDKRHAALDSVITRQLMEEEDETGDLYEGLYSNWSDTRVNPYDMGIANMKDSFSINVSQYYPPCLGAVTSAFGSRHRGFHNGIDLRVHVGDTIRAAFSGRVRVRRYNRGGYGYFLVLRHHGGLETVYGHLSKFLVGPNQEIKAGDPIALGGNTGRSTGPHLHFESRIYGNPINPAKMFSFEAYVPLRNTYYVVKSKTFEERIRYSGGHYGGIKLSPEDMGSGSYTEGSYSQVKYYSVRKGDVLYGIAKKNGISVSALCKLNNIKSSSKIKPGQRLRLS
ncbi:MAG: M23 family metallopeptidase [Bacteroidales bacterium]|nr:M23 family metallopeptidase [Bacteroidales bacterium]